MFRGPDSSQRGDGCSAGVAATRGRRLHDTEEVQLGVLSRFGAGLPSARANEAVERAVKLVRGDPEVTGSMSTTSGAHSDYSRLHTRRDPRQPPNCTEKHDH